MEILQALIQKINTKTKPLGSLGLLENIAIQIGLIQNTLSPVIKNPTLLVFAADHGITAEGVSAYPKEVTTQMVHNFLNGGAAINVFCRQHNIALKIVDAGVDADFENSEMLIHAKIRKGTSNILKSPAMTLDECNMAINKGAEIVFNEYKKGCNTIAFGEMGIGNTSSAALLMSRYCGIPIDQCVGKGTGHNKEGLKKKTAILQQALNTHNSSSDPLITLSTFGGFEIAMIAGAMLKAAELNMVILIDGFIISSALLAAFQLNKNILKNCIFCHTSNEKGHRLMLKHFKAKPVLDLNLRLGEGTGAAVAFPIIQSAINFLNEMSSFESAGISKKE